MEVNVEEFLKKIGLHDEFDEAQESSSDSQYFSYKPHDFQRIDVESTASGLMESVTKMSYEAQCKLFVELVKLVPDVGVQVVFNRPEGSRKQRGARVVRLKTEHDTRISLLITR